MGAPRFRPAFLTATDVSQRLGMHPATFRRCRADLYRAGFPRPDALMKGRYHADDVEAWIESRRTEGSPDTSKGVKVDAL